MDFINNRYPKLNNSECFIAGDEHQFFDKAFDKDLEKYNADLKDEDFVEHNKRFSQGPVSVMNTFLYIFYKFKKGLYIKIRNNEVVLFLPFINQNYTNEWWNKFDILKSEDSIFEFCKYTQLYSHYYYLVEKGKIDTKNTSFESFFKINKYRKIEYKPKQEWHANNGIFRFDKSAFNKTTNNKLSILKMFQTLCEKRTVPDVDFFVNTRDNPLLAKNEYEPYYHIYGKNHPLISYNFDKICPIMSMSSSDYYDDIKIPTFEDWNRVMTSEYKQILEWDSKISYDYNFNYDWDSKIPKAVFRGSSTGFGYDSNTNPRIKLHEIYQENKDILDVSITKWQVRPRIYNKEIKFIKPNNISVQRLTPEEQSNYKYIIHVEGHVSAYRLSLEMNMGSCILMIDSKWKMWFSEFLKPFKHYIPIKSDLSDLVEKVNWCKENDNKCKIIAMNAKKFYDEHLTENNILDYLQKILQNISVGNTKEKFFYELNEFYNQDKKYLIKNLPLLYYKKLNFKEKFYKRYVRIEDKIVKYLVIKNLDLGDKFFIDSKSAKYNFMKKFITDNTINFNNKLWVECSFVHSDIKNILKFIKDEPSFYPENIKILVDNCVLSSSRLGLNTLNAIRFCLLHRDNMSFFYSEENISDSGKLKIIKIHEHLHIKEKTYKSEDSLLNESFISLNCLNSLLEYTPNFSFGFYMKKGKFYSEYIQGETLQYYLLKSILSEDELFKIFLQVMFSILQAQAYCGFIHNDLTTYNIIIKPLSEEIELTYFYKKKYSLKSKFMAYIIDYDKSSVVSKNMRHVSVHMGNVNGFNKLKSQDLFMLLLTIQSDISNSAKYKKFLFMIKSIVSNVFFDKLKNGENLSDIDYNYFCKLFKKYTINVSCYRNMYMDRDCYEILLKYFPEFKKYESNKRNKFTSDNKILSEYILEHGELDKAWEKTLEYYYTTEFFSNETYISAIFQYFKIFKSLEFETYYKNIQFDKLDKLKNFFVDRYNLDLKTNKDDMYSDPILLSDKVINKENIEILDYDDLLIPNIPRIFYHDYSETGFLLRSIIHSDIENVLYFDKKKLTDLLKTIIILRFDYKNKVANYNSCVLNRELVKKYKLMIK